MIKFQQLYRAYQLYRQKSEYLGDVAILKADAFDASMTPELAEKMQPVVGYYPNIDLEKLSQLPDGTFGREYARHMRNNHLKPLNVSPELTEIADRNVFALRYAITHDIFHLLLGFDTSYAGEMGVLAFAVAQNYSPQNRLGLLLGRVIYPILAPGQIEQIFANIRKGKELGERAEFLLKYRFEEWWEKSLVEVRFSLGLPEVANLAS
ncbi:hypothetical protein IQ235_11165 [Oscillatoriales cyanobacterium LEGE 11467]|uniref:Ubiquinone biosynthesis protein n=1 Tax=Zarconia navalis LEGE 11467 TaxID=1828826 RepID=A0A928W136_9CYAN|nr:Coq4 family protein [Zarconia navalis]MBE9041340.1 hypothetical protein [Zarconia navalis LEGE 11467]